MNKIYPIRIQLSRQKKQVSPNGLPIVYVGRGGRWGNPFRVVKLPDGRWTIKTDGSEQCSSILTSSCKYSYGTKEEAKYYAIECYKKLIDPYHHGAELSDFFISISNHEDAKKTLSGKNLSCWCKLGEKCHADFLIEFANSN